MTVTHHRTRAPRRVAAAVLAAGLIFGTLSPVVATASDADPASSTGSTDAGSSAGERRFAPAGTEVSGADRASSANAPTLTAGAWTDTISSGEAGIRYYSVQRSIPGSRLRISAFSDPGQTEGNPTERLNLSLLTADDAASCSSSVETNRYNRSTAHLVSATALSSISSYDQENCVDVDTLVLRVERTGGPVPSPVQINVVEEPPLASDGNIPAGLSTTPQDPRPLTVGDDIPVRGGASFADAPLLTNGTYVDELVPGEVAYYRATVDWGQHATFALVGPVDDQYVGSSSESLEIVPKLYRPDLRDLSNDARASGSSAEHRYSLDSLPVQHLMSVPELRYNNRAQGYQIAPFNLAGDYYYALSVPTSRQGTAEGRPVPVRFAVEVAGEAKGTPDYTEPFQLGGSDTQTESEGDSTETTADAGDDGDTQASGTDSASTDDSLPYLVMAGIALVVLLGAAAGLLMTGRSRRRTPLPHEGITIMNTSLPRRTLFRPTSRTETPRGRTATTALTLALGLACATAPLAGAAAASVDLAATGLTTVTPERSESEQDSKIMLVMDASGSMGDDLPDGQTRMAAAKKSLHEVIDSIPDSTEVGLRVYGATEGASEANDRVCGDTQLVHPLGALDRDALREQVDAMEPFGWTPIAHSLSEAAKDLGDDGQRHIILVSDGEETCVPDPCPEIREIIDSGIDVQIDTIGFGVDDTARNQLQCISEAAGGSYYDAEDAEGLTVALERVTTRALREFNVTGTRVEGVDRNNLGQVPVLTAGQYVDTIATGDYGIRYYRIQREFPQSRLSVSLTSRPPRSESTSWESFEISLVNDRGESCSWDGRDARWGSGLTDFVVANATTRSAWDSDRKACLEPDNLLLQVQRRQGSQVPVDVELVVHEEPTVTSDAGLPDGLPNAPQRPAGQSTRKAEPVVGGAAFSNAPELKPGTYVDELIPGEIVYYRVPVGWGQSAVLTVDQIVGDRYVGSGFNGSLRVLPRLYSPDRRNVSNAASDYTDSHTFALDEVPSQHVMVIPEVRYLNRGESTRNVGEHHLAGDYYYALAVPTTWQGTAEGRPVPVQFTVSVDGQVSGAPSYLDTRLSTANGADADAGDAAADGAAVTQDADGSGSAGDDQDGSTADADHAATTQSDDGTGADSAAATQDTDVDADAGQATAQDDDAGSSQTWLWIAGLGALFLLSFFGAAVVNSLRRR